jgi:hypothetical protein
MNNVITKLHQINKKFSTEYWLDFEVQHFIDGNMRLIASTDFSYYHLLELDLINVSYFNGPTSWGTSPKNTEFITRLEDNRTNEIIAKYKIETPCFIIAINTDDNYQVICAATNINFNFDLVYYYQRDNLKPNERICIRNS